MAAVLTWAEFPALGTVNYYSVGKGVLDAWQLNFVTLDEDTQGLKDGSLIGDNTIINRHIGPDAVDSTEIAADAIGPTELATDAVGNDAVADDAIGEANLQDGSVAADKLQISGTRDDGDVAAWNETSGVYEHVPNGSGADSGQVRLIDAGTPFAYLGDILAAGFTVSSTSIAAQGLEAVTEGGNTGWRLIGAIAANYGDIGEGAVDLSYSPAASGVFGATGDYSHAEGYTTTASGNNSHAEGGSTVSSGTASHAEGAGTLASGFAAHAGGQNTVSSGTASHAGGIGTVAQNDGALSCGKYNDNGSLSTVLEVGMGTGTSARANAFQVHDNGNIAMPNLPTSNPGPGGFLWNDGGTLKIS